MPGLIRPPKTSRLPDIVTVGQAQALFGATRILSYRVFFFTLYSLGLRLSEGLALSVADIDAERARVHIRGSKGNRDRVVPVPGATLVLLRRFWQTHRNPELLFPNRHGGLKGAALVRTPLDRGGVQRALRQVTLACGIKKISPHSLRHSYTTHLIEASVSTGTGITNPNPINTGNHTGWCHHLLRVRVPGPTPRPATAQPVQSRQGHADLSQQPLGPDAGPVRQLRRAAPGAAFLRPQKLPALPTL